MSKIELTEIKNYWFNKYPNVHVTLYANECASKFYGKMTAQNDSCCLEAESIGALIYQGENFLRKVANNK